MTDNSNLLAETERINKELDNVFNLLAINIAPIKENISKKLTPHEKALGL